MIDRNNLKEIRERIGLTQKELAEMTGLTIQTIRSIENGRRGGSEDTWGKIEEAINSIQTDVRITAKDGTIHTFVVKGEERYIFQMYQTAVEKGYDIDSVDDYLKSMVGYWEEALLNQRDMIASEEDYTYDEHVLRALGKISEDMLTLPNLAKYFPAWLGVKES